MSLLSNLFGYNRPGPGVRPDEPRKKGAARWFEILGRDLGSFFKAGLLALLGFLPFMLLLSLAIASHAVIFVIAAGVVGGALAMPQIVGMADTLLRSLRDEPGFWWVTYRRAWKRNWKGCLVPGMVCGLVIAGQLFTLFHLRPDNDNLLMLVVMLILGMALSVGLTFYIVPQLALLDLPFLQILKNSVLLFLGYLPRTAGAVAVQVVYWGAYLLFYPLTTLVLPFTNFWLPMSLTLLILYIPLDKSFHIEETIRKMRAEDLAARSDAPAEAWPPAPAADPLPDAGQTGEGAGPETDEPAGPEPDEAAPAEADKAPEAPADEAPEMSDDDTAPRA